MNDAHANLKFNRVTQGNGAISTEGNKTVAILIGIMRRATDWQKKAGRDYDLWQHHWMKICGKNCFRIYAAPRVAAASSL